MKDVSTQGRPDAVALIAMATGWLAVGAIAVGAIAIGSIAIGALAIKKVKLRTVEIDELTVRRLRVLENTTPHAVSAASDDQPSAIPSDAAPETNGEARPRPAPRRRRPRKPMPN